MTSDAPLLSVEALRVGHGSQTVLENVDLELQSGERLGLVGHNGAGKTTFLRTLAGLHRPHAGIVRVRGSSKKWRSSRKLVKDGLVLAPQGRALFPGMTVRENVMLGGLTLTRKQARSNWEASVERWPLMKEHEHQSAASLSGGQQQMVTIARGLASEPTLFLIDEPSVGLSGVAVAELARGLLNSAAEGTTLVLAEQNMGLALEVCTRFVVLKDRGIIADFARADLPTSGLWAFF